MVSARHIKFRLITRAVFLGCCILTGCCIAVLASGNDKDTDKTWVAISLFDGRRNMAVEYYGKIDTQVFDDIKNRSITNGFFKLESSCWFDNEKHVQQLKNETQAGQLLGYSNTAFFRVEVIIRIILLDPSFVKDVLEKQDKTEPPLSPVKQAKKNP